MHSDCFFFTGKSHNVCEDYSRCGRTNMGASYAIISDGCSSSEHTDIGARILVCSAEERIATTHENLFDKKFIDNAARICSCFPGVDTDCLDATLLSVISDDILVWIQVIGDGVLGFINNDDSLDIIDIEYPSGAPWYLSYSLNKEREDKYIEKYGTKAIISSTKDGTITEQKERFQYFYVDRLAYKAILLMSDGVKSFTKKVVSDSSKGNVPITYHEVLKELLAFKGYQGEFIKRRVKRFIKDMPKLGWENYDDVSVAGIYLGE